MLTAAGGRFCGDDDYELDTLSVSVTRGSKLVRESMYYEMLYLTVLQVNVSVDYVCTLNRENTLALDGKHAFELFFVIARFLLD